MKIILIAILLFSNMLFAQKLEDIKWITENYPPNNFQNEKGELAGFTVDILVEMWKIVGLKKSKSDINLYPWARGIHNLDSFNDVCLFGMGINKERLKKYSFVGKIPNSIRALIAKKSMNYKFNSIDDINNNVESKKIGAVRDDISGNSFVSAGGNNDLVHYVSEGDQLIKMLKAKRVDLIAFADASTYKLMKKHGLNRFDYEIVYIFSQDISGYAFNKKTSPSIINKLQKAYDKLWKDGTIMKIRDKYLK